MHFKDTVVLAQVEYFQNRTQLVAYNFCSLSDLLIVWLMCCRENYGDYFGITVAGYPEAHPEVITDDAEAMERAYQEDLQYLKKKLDVLHWPCDLPT